MAAEFGQSEDVWQSGISCGGGWFANSVTYTGVNERTDDDGRWLRALLLLIEQAEMIAQQQKQIEALAAGLQKVSGQLATASPSRGGLELSKFANGRIRRGGLELSKCAPQIVNNP